MNKMELNLDPTYLLGSFIFGLIGFALWRYGRKTESKKHTGLAVALMVYPYFVEKNATLFIVGTILTVLIFWPKIDF